MRFLLFLLLCIIAAGIGVFVNLPRTEFSIGSFSFAFPVEIDEPETISRTKIRFVGDVMLARNVEYLMDTYGSSYPYESLPVQPQDSYLVGNFEAAIPKIHVPTPSMQFSFSVDPVHLQGLQQYGFTHLGLSNNHAYDFGTDDFEHGKTLLADNGFVPFGDPGYLGTTSIAYIDLGTTTVALVGVYAVHEAPQAEKIAEVFAEAADNSDVQIAYVHWGDEYELVHNGSQERLAQKFIDAGADAVVGHHPHVVQDIGIYKDVPIFYSLGNFIFDQYFSDEVQQGLMLETSFSSSKIRFELLPVSSIGTRSQTRLMGAYERDLLLEALGDRSEESVAEMIKNGYIEVSF